MAKFFMICVAIVLPEVSTQNVAGTIEEDLIFYYRNLSVYPSKSATIEFRSVSYYSAGLPVIKFDIYTFRENDILPMDCTDRKFGQLRNEYLHRNFHSEKYRHSPCKSKKDSMLHCYGKVPIQDYIPRQYGFSFSFDCGVNMTLQGLKFNISIYNQSNETKCIKVPGSYECSKFYNYACLPDLIGETSLTSILDIFDRFAFLQIKSSGFCYNQEHITEILCLFYLPKCDSQQNQIIHPCRETCHELLQGCFVEDLSLFHRLLKYLGESPFRDFTFKIDKINNYTDDFKKLANCDYLPSKDGDIPCFYKPVTCSTPPSLENTKIEDKFNSTKYNLTSSNATFPLHSAVVYSCLDDAFDIKGNGTIMCMYSGRWSDSPECIQKPKESRNPMTIVLPCLITSCVITLALCLFLKYAHRRERFQYTRDKEYDAFVCYAYVENGHKFAENDQNFAEETIRIHLEEKRQFKLCIHRRDFLAGWDTMWNIRNAIKNSNSAIIVMSQNYINSLWCKEEFEQCYYENLKDPAFKLFVIMMQPKNTLLCTSGYINSFFERTTYLEKNDPKLFKKISAYLTWIKQPKGETAADTEKADFEECIDLIEKNPAAENIEAKKEEPMNGEIIAANAADVSIAEDSGSDDDVDHETHGLKVEVHNNG